MSLPERYKALLGNCYDAGSSEFVKERAKARKAAVEFQKYAGTYLSINDPEEYRRYLDVRHAMLPNLSDTCIVEHGLHVDYGINIYGGENGLISFNCTILDSTRVYIGKNVFIGSNVVITDVSHPFDKEERVQGRGVISKPISIGNGTWICSNATICQGVTIGYNCIIAANAVVRHDVPPNSIVAGTDGRIIGSL